MGGDEPHGGDAFGLRISSTVAVPGLQPLRVRPARKVLLRVVRGRGALSRRLGQEVLYRGAGDPPHLLIDRRPSGYGVWSPRMGRYEINADGAEIRASLPDGSAWQWQLLFAQTLPITAAIWGLEVLHASAVAIDGGVIGILAPSGSGKSTLASELVRDGAGFVADDALALEADGGRILAHPGVGIANVSPQAFRQGVAHNHVVARTTKLHLAVPRVHGPLPLRALVFLERVAPGRTARIERVPLPDPLLLLGSTFVFVVREPARLIRQLDIHQIIAATVPVLHACLPWADRPGELAHALEQHL